MTIVLKNPRFAGGGGKPDGSEFRIDLLMPSGTAEMRMTHPELTEFFNQLDQFVLHIQAQQRAAMSGVAIQVVRAEDAEAEAAPESGNVYVGFRPKGRSVRTFEIAPQVARKLAKQLSDAANLLETSRGNAN